MSIDPSPSRKEVISYLPSFDTANQVHNNLFFMVAVPQTLLTLLLLYSTKFSRCKIFTYFVDRGNCFLEVFLISCKSSKIWRYTVQYSIKFNLSLSLSIPLPHPLKKVDRLYSYMYIGSSRLTILQYTT